MIQVVFLLFYYCFRPKYGITDQRSGYRGIMRLIVRSFSISDVGTYHCVSTNSLGRAEGTLRLYGKFFFFSKLLYAKSKMELRELFKYIKDDNKFS